MIIRLPSDESHIVRENVEEDNFYVIVAPQLTAIPFCPSILLQKFNAAALSFKDGWEFWEVFSIYIKLKQKTREKSILITLPFGFRFMFHVSLQRSIAVTTCIARNINMIEFLKESFNQSKI